MVTQAAFLFPGQGSQYVGMGKAAAEASAAAKQRSQEADQWLGFSLSQIMFEGPEEKLRDTAITQPALFVASALALERLREKSIAPWCVAGHSLGEYSALYAAGVLSFSDALMLVQARGRAMQAAAEKNLGTMAAIIGLNATQVTDICRAASGPESVCAPANFNSESQIVISGGFAAVNRAVEAAKAAGAAKAIQLNVSGAFHSPLMSPAVEAMRPVIMAANFQDASVPVYTNVDAEPTRSGAEFKRKLIEQIDHPVRWHDTLRRLILDGAQTFIEVGSGKVLGTMAKKLDRSKTVLWTDEFDGIEKLKETQCA